MRKRFTKLKRTRPVRGVPNRLEAEWLEICREKLRTGEYIDVRFEALTLRLADRVRYTPDIYVLTSEGQVIFFETKGFMREDARVKLQCAANQWRDFQFVLVMKKRKQWIQEMISPTE